MKTRHSIDFYDDSAIGIEFSWNAVEFDAGIRDEILR